MSSTSKKKKDNEDIAKVEYDLQGMTYTEFVHKELNDKLNALREKENNINKAINEALEEIRVKKSDGGGLKELVSKLREKLKEVTKERSVVNREYEVDHTLSFYARELDSAYSRNRGRNLIIEASEKVNEIINMLPKILECYGCEYYAPFAYAAIKHSMYGLAGSLNVELPKLQIMDKNLLLNNFNKRLAEVENEKKEKRLSKEKYTDLLI